MGYILSAFALIVICSVGYCNKDKMKDIGTFAQGMGALLAALAALIAAEKADEIIKEINFIKKTIETTNESLVTARKKMEDMTLQIERAEKTLEEVKGETLKNSEEIRKMKEQADTEAARAAEIVMKTVQSQGSKAEKTLGIVENLREITVPREWNQANVSQTSEYIFTEKEANEVAKRALARPESAKEEVENEVKRKFYNILGTGK